MTQKGGVVITVAGHEDRNYAQTVFLADCFKIQIHLKKYYDFTTDQTPDDWESHKSASSLLSYLEKVGENKRTEIVFFYYSGHGRNDGSTEFPMFRLGDDPEYVTMEMIMKALGEKKLIISVFDCCNSVPKPKENVEKITKEDPIWLGKNTLFRNILERYEGQIQICSSSKCRPSYFEGFARKLLLQFDEYFRKIKEDEMGFESAMESYFEDWTYNANGKVMKPVVSFKRKLHELTHSHLFVHKFTGYGMFSISDVEWYKGEWKNGKPHGKGTRKCDRGRYEGEWKNDFQHGKGTFYYIGGDRYEGQFENGGFHGKGTYYYSDGDRYEGQYENGEKHGKGIMYYKEGDRYEGQFENGDCHGKGTYYFSDGDRYEGEYENGQPHGKGTQSFGNGDRYEGEYENGVKNGKGTYSLSNGDRYEGEWKNGKRHGKGIMYYSDGDRYEGQYENGEKHGKGTFYYNSGRYEGQFENGKRHGKGILYNSNGDRFEGQFENGKRHGKGILYYRNGDRYEGQFENGKMHGKGILYKSSGFSKVYQYENGKKI